MTLSSITIAGVLRGEEPPQTRVRNTDYEFCHCGERDEEEEEKFRSLHVSLMSWTNEYGTCVLRECPTKSLTAEPSWLSGNYSSHVIGRFIAFLAACCQNT